MRGRLGTRRTARHLTEDVNLRAIPFLEHGYRELGVGEFPLAGTAPKTLIVFPTEIPRARSYLAKAPSKPARAGRPGTGPLECVTEYVIARIGRLLPLRVAGARLIRFRERPRDVRFMSRNFLRPGETLVHGVELVSRLFGLSEEDEREQLPRTEAAERRFYTLDFVHEVLREVALPRGAHEGLSDALARMIAFDALVGANDRHAQNWGVVLDPRSEMRFAPIFDTARGLFRNISDAVMERRDRAGERDEFIEQYATGSQPLITATGRKHDNHFDVVRHIVSEGGPCARPIRFVIGAFRPDRVTEMLHAEFRRILSRRRLEYIDRLLRLRHGRLMNICRRPKSGEP